MPYARVSAMPQPTEEADGSVSSKGKGSIRGITIQDLKKQTAQRLAQEQHRKVSRGKSSNNGGSNNGRGFRNRRGNKSQPIISDDESVKKQSSNKSSNSNSSSTRSNTSTPVILTDEMIQHNILMASRGDGASVASMGSRSGPGPNASVNKCSNSTSRSPAPSNNKSGGYWRKQSHTNNSLQTAGGYQQRGPPTSQSYSKPSVGKLPHGLTVHELKAMTRARLEAELAVTKQREAVPVPPASSQWRPGLEMNPSMFPQRHSPQPPSTPVLENHYNSSLPIVHAREAMIPMSPGMQRTPAPTPVVIGAATQNHSNVFTSPWDQQAAMRPSHSCSSFNDANVMVNGLVASSSFYGYDKNSMSVPASPAASNLYLQHGHNHGSAINSPVPPTGGFVRSPPPPPPAPQVSSLPNTQSILDDGDDNGMPEWVAESVLFSPELSEGNRKVVSHADTHSKHVNQDRYKSSFDSVFREPISDSDEFNSQFGFSLSFGAIGENTKCVNESRPRIASAGSMGFSTDFSGLLNVNECDNLNQSEPPTRERDIDNLLGFLSSTSLNPN